MPSSRELLLGNGMAARSASAAIKHAGDRLSGPGSAQSDAFRVTGFRQGLKEAGYVEGQNLTIEYRWAEDHYDRLPAMAADLVRRQVAVLVATNAAMTRTVGSSLRGNSSRFGLSSSPNWVTPGFLSTRLIRLPTHRCACPWQRPQPWGLNFMSSMPASNVTSMRRSRS